MKEIAITGIGAYSPSKVVSNDDLGAIVDTNDEWIVERTGIKQRRISSGEDTAFMGAQAAKEALEMADISPKDIDLIVVATMTPDMFTPSTACIVQKLINAENATAFDVNAACSGFVFGLQIVESLMKVQNYNNALLIGAETLSKLVDWKDRSTCVLFGDGAGAVVISKSEQKGVYKTFTDAQGEKGHNLTAGALTVKNPFIEVIEEKDKYLKMNGREVFKFATSVIVGAINKVLEESNLSIEDIAYIVPHQANIRIIEYSAKKLKVPVERFYTNIDKYGNTSAASVPVALDELHKSGNLEKGDKVILVGFGGGLTYGAALIEWCI